MSILTSSLAVDLDRAGECDVAARCNLLQACRACTAGEFGLLQRFSAEHEIRVASHAELREAANQILAQYAPPLTQADWEADGFGFTPEPGPLPRIR